MWRRFTVASSAAAVGAERRPDTMDMAECSHDSRKIAIMPTRTTAASISGANVYLRPPRMSDAAAFLDAARRSRALHGPWTRAPTTAERFALFVQRYAPRREPIAHSG